jgi:hypothetical protein
MRITESRLRRIIREELEELTMELAADEGMDELDEYDRDDSTYQSPEYGAGTWRKSDRKDYDPYAHDTDSKSGYSRPGYRHDDEDRYKSGYGS